MSENGSTTRREFLKTSSVAMAALAASGNYAYAQGSDKIKLGLIGCGGRGTGAAGDSARSSEGVEVVALGDLFLDRLEGSKNHLKNSLGDKFKATDDRCFSGFDAYKKVLETDANLVILATPPGFRPIHLEAAIKAGKHVFMEKPVAVDAPGVRRVMAAGEMAAGKKLGIVAGTQRRHDFGYKAVMERLHAGDMGEIVAAQCYWNQGGLWSNERQPGWTEVEYQLRNWLYYTWLSGDHIVEQHIHNLDVVNWAMNSHPAKVVGVGGRQVRTEPIYGHIFDHFGLEYEYPNGARVLSLCRQQDGTASRVEERIVGTKGVSNASSSIKGEKSFRYDGKRTNPYVQEHTDLIASIRAGMPLNESKTVAESTLTAIMGRMAAYTGQEVSWEKAMNSEQVWMPADVKFGQMGVPPVAMPGRTRLE